jgi:hypothetical protein
MLITNGEETSKVAVTWKEHDSNKTSRHFGFWKEYFNIWKW